MGVMRPIEELPENSNIVALVWENWEFGRQIVTGWRNSNGELVSDDVVALDLATHFVDPEEFAYEDEDADLEKELKFHRDYVEVLTSCLNSTLDLMEKGEYNVAYDNLYSAAIIATFNSKYRN